MIGCEGSGRNSVRGANQPPYSGMGNGCRWSLLLDMDMLLLLLLTPLFMVADVCEVCRAEAVEAANDDVVIDGGCTLNSRSLV